MSTLAPTYGRGVPAAVAVGSRVVWIESVVEGTGFRCAPIRTLGWSGSDPTEAPWRVPCEVDTHRYSPRADVVSLDELALYAAIDAPFDPGPPARAILVALTGEGRRASAVSSFEADAASVLAVATQAERGALAFTSGDSRLLRFRWEGAP